MRVKIFGGEILWFGSKGLDTQPSLKISTLCDENWGCREPQTNNGSVTDATLANTWKHFLIFRKKSPQNLNF